MVFNGVTEYLRRYCYDMEERCRKRSEEERLCTGRSLLFVKGYFFEEMAYKLAALVDWDAPSFEAYRERVRALIPVRKAYVLRNERVPEALALIREAEEELRDFLVKLTEQNTAEPEHYIRVILGEERERLEYAILEKWGYCADYWYPLKGSFDESKLFLSVDWFEPYWDRLCALVGLPEHRVYEYGESYFDDGQLLEVDDITGYGGNECAYLPKVLSWIIYFSHEGTVTFAGTILPAVRELLASEREHWNKWE